MRSIAVTGTSTTTSRRVVELLGTAWATAARIVVVEDVVGGPAQADQLGPEPGLVRVPLDVLCADLRPVLAGCDTVVHLGSEEGALRSSQPSPRLVEATRRVLDAATEAGVSAAVYRSSATVYGAWGDNAIPLTEDAAIRPNPGVDDAVLHAEAERLVARWAEARPGLSACVLRPVPVVGEGVPSRLSEALVAHAPLRPQQLDPPRQFLHADDLADAVLVAVERRLDGVFNVAPDGWLGGEAVRVLGAGGPAIEVPRKLASAAARWAWDLHLSGLPPELLPLVEQPWVVANDRLRAHGWTPAHSNEEAVVASRPGSWWREMSPNRRQELALGGSVGAGVVGAVSLAAVALRRRRHRRRTTPLTAGE